MIPEYLKIKGLYSYQTEQEIDFRPLTDAALFGVFGAVGSGKSSVLEAITFALYGDTERLNNKGDDRTYNMMNLRSDELLIDFECIAGKLGNKYRFTVRGKRNSKNFKEVKTFERRAYIRENESWVPLPENYQIEEIVGLSYENFRRTIIIPQGRFQEFIELRDAERTRMMKELFQLGKYDLGNKTGSLNKQNDIALSHIDGQLTSLGEVSDEAILAENVKKTQVQEEIVKVQAELATQTALEANYQSLKAAAEKVAALQDQLTALKAQQPQMQVRENALKTFETCSLHFKSIFDQKKNLLENQARDEKQYAQHEVESKRLLTLLAKQKETLTQLQPQYATRETLLDTAEELEKLVQIRKNGQSVEKRKESLAKGEQQLKAKNEHIELLKLQKQEKEAENDLHKGRQVDVQEMGSVKSWFATLENLTENRQAVKKEADNLQAELAVQQKILTENLQKIRSSLIPALGEDLLSTTFQTEMRQALLRNNDDRKTLSEQLLKANTKAALQQYAVSLADGEPCPLCGSLHHPDVRHGDESVENELDRLGKKISELDEKESQLRTLQSQTERIFNQIDNLEKQKASIKERWNEAKGKIEQHDQLFVWPTFDKTDKGGFEKRFEEASQNQAKIRETDLILKKLAQQIDLENQEKTEQIEKPLQVLRDEILRFENTISTLTEQLEKVDPETFKYETDTAILEKITGLKKSYIDIASLFEQTEKEVDALEKQQNVLSGSLSTLKVALEGYVHNLASVQNDIAAQLTRFAFKTEEEVLAVLKQEIRIESERKEIDSFKFALETTTRELENRLKDAPAESYNAELHLASTQAKEALNLALNNLQKEEGGLDRLIKKLAEDLAKKTALQEQKSKLQLRKEHLDTLTKLFRSSGFVDYASSIYLNNLIQAANHRFHQMTHQQLHLELGEGNSFWIRDLLNGGHLRLLKTLSGGQKFQAALSLALALADHIHVRNESTHNFFFLDEGFGSLDKNALQTVFETLKSLRKENRIVGIISHVEDLQQEIQTYLKITETEEGSRIEASWK